MPIKAYSWEKVKEKIDIPEKLREQYKDLLEDKAGNLKDVKIVFYQESAEDPDKFDLAKNFPDDGGMTFEKFLENMEQQRQRMINEGRLRRNKFSTPGAIEAGFAKKKGADVLKGVEPSSVPASGVGEDDELERRFNALRRDEPAAKKQKPLGPTEAKELREEAERLTKFNETVKKCREIYTKLASRKDISITKYYPDDVDSDYREYVGFIDKYRSGNLMAESLKFSKTKSKDPNSQSEDRFNELQKKMDAWNEKWEKWLEKNSILTSSVPDVSVSSTASSSLSSTPPPSSSLPSPSTAVSGLNEEDDVFLRGAGLTASMASSISLEPADTRSDTSVESRPDVIFSNQMHKQAMPKLADIVKKDLVLTKGRKMDEKAFKDLTSAWIKQIKKESSKEDVDNVYKGVRCEKQKPPLPKDSIKTTIPISKDKNEEITHSYVNDRPKVTMTDPPSDRSIFLFMESSKEMAPLTLQGPCNNLDTALKLYEASIISGTKIELDSDDIEALKRSDKHQEHFDALCKIEDKPGDVEKFREAVQAKADYELGKLENKPAAPTELSAVGRLKTPKT